MSALSSAVRFPLRLSSALAVVLLLLRVCVGLAWAQSDPRAEARARYQAGQRAYAAGNYRDAIREFAAAEQLAPSGYNDYNLGLCYDKLGEADPAVKYYRSYLQRVTEAKNRAAVEASIARLESAMTSAESKERARMEAERRAEEARRAEAARQAEEAKRAEEAKQAEEAKRAEEAKQAEEAKSSDADADSEAPAAPSAPAAPTGNPQLDRVNGVDLAAIRAERSALLGVGPTTAPQATGEPGASTEPGAVAGGQGARDKAPKATPVYKKWWFYALIGVGAFVVYRVATQERTSTQRNFLSEQPAPTGATLLRW
ncbi:MAG: hypothetical protein R3B48_08485 [Kofleriaceae bacterium]